MFKILSTCKGGGYRYCRTDPPHPRRNAKGLYPLHRVLLENKLGRLLRKGEIAHHINEDKTDDRPRNIVLLTNSNHTGLHHPAKKLKKFKCVMCKKSFQLKPHVARLRMSRNSTKKLACSPTCGVAYGNRLRGAR